ncbi:methyltransferase [Saccharopolyspora phatthalungensis]|uniref:Pyochelin synthetase n=1 Tax=Saccharopolyspora phatthalungensis TaxID=664693 RepID=A0A840QKJ9_9PSEU|nr:methyltransferase [Saccharopolyspora phatthalungensis]MBB5158993.1 pyochelin synthetase [Saccharopolyspora phatthalungensis]
MPISRTKLDSLRARIEQDDTLRAVDELRELAAELNSGDSAATARVRAWSAVLGADARTVMVALPLDAGGRDAAIAALLVGARVVLADATAHPARTLAELERTGADHAVLDSARLARLAAEPAVPLTDLAALRRILHVGGPAAFDAVETVHLTSDPSGVVGVAGADREIGAGLIAAIESVAVDGLTQEHTAEFVARFDEAVLAAMLHTLQAHGVLTDPAVSHTTSEVLTAAGVSPRHHAVVERWLTALTERGVLGSDGDRTRGTAPIDRTVVDAAWDAAHRLWTGRLGGAEVMAYFRLNADRLPQLLSGAEQAALLLFPEGRTDIADALYRDTATARYLNTAVGAAMRVLAGGPTPPRVLEVGAGTGATSEVVLADLAESGVDGVDYLFTDVSPFFLDGAQKRFAAYDFVRYGVYDIDRDNREQDFVPASVDVLIAAGALNNARDADATLRRLHELLVPGGWLLLIEPTREYLEILISQAFMMTAAEDARLRSGTTFLSRQQWHEALEKAGFTVVHTTPGGEHPLAPLSQYLFTAQR